MFPNPGISPESTQLFRNADGTYVQATGVPAVPASGEPPPSTRKGPSVGTRQMKRKLPAPGHADGGDRAGKKARTEPFADPQPASLASSEPGLKVLPPRGSSVPPAQSANKPIPEGRMPSTRTVRFQLDTCSSRALAGPVPPAVAPSATSGPSGQVRFQLDTNPSRKPAGPIPQQAVEQPRTAGQMINEDDLRALRTLLQGAARAGNMAAKADLLRHAAGTGKLDAFNLLLEFGALEALRGEAPRVERPSLLEYVAWGQNPAILDRLEACGLPIRGYPRDALVMAIAQSGRKGGMLFLQRLCAAADSADVRFQPADMRKIFLCTVQWEKNEHCQRVTSPEVMEWLMARYIGSFDASVFAAPLWKSVDVSNWPAAEYLLGVCGASPHLIGERNRSLLMLAAARGRYSLYDLLRFHGADPHAIDADGQSVLHHAVQGPGYSIVSDLALQRRVNTLARDNQGRTAAELAAQLGKPHFVTVLESQPTEIDYLARL